MNHFPILLLLRVVDDIRTKNVALIILKVNHPFWILEHGHWNESIKLIIFTKVGLLFDLSFGICVNENGESRFIDLIFSDVLYFLRA